MFKKYSLLLAAVFMLSNLVYIQPALAETGDWMARLRLLQVSPNDDSSSVSTIPGSSVSVESDTTIELDFTYFLTPNLGVEFILGTSRHDIQAEGSIEAVGKIATVRTLPPVVTLQHHFQPNATIRPYVGIGVNYTTFYDETASGNLESALGGSTSIKLDDSWGLSAQIGTDIALNEAWFINLDAKYLQLGTTAELNTGGLVRRVDVDIDPWFFSVGFGTNF